MTTALLPPYFRCVPDTSERLNESMFAQAFTSLYHPKLPLVMRRDYYEAGESSGTFRHLDFLALYAVRGGRAVHWIDDHRYGLVRGDVYLMAPGAAHRFCQFTQLEVDVFFFQSTLFSSEELAALRQSPGIWRLFAGDAGMEHRIHASPEEWRGIELQIEIMRQEWGEGSPTGALLLKHSFFRLLAVLARLRENSQSRPAGHREEQRLDWGLAEALRYCEEHLDKQLSVPRLAARAFLSRSHFTDLFSREVGMSPAAYVRHIRLEKARTLLCDTNLPVSQIAGLCGFRNAAQFSRAFSNLHELPPLQYRKREQQDA